MYFRVRRRRVPHGTTFVFHIMPSENIFNLSVFQIKDWEIHLVQPFKHKEKEEMMGKRIMIERSDEKGGKGITEK